MNLTVVRLQKRTAPRSKVTLTYQRSITRRPLWSPEMRTNLMVQLAQLTSKQRSERRIAVRLPLKVRGRDSRGFAFEEDTSSENLCRSGAAFITRFDVAIGSDLEIRIPLGHAASRRYESDFATQGRVVHVADAAGPGEHVIGVQFTGPRFQRMFR